MTIYLKWDLGQNSVEQVILGDKCLTNGNDCLKTGSLFFITFMWDIEVFTFLLAHIQDVFSHPLNKRLDDIVECIEYCYSCNFFLPRSP